MKKIIALVLALAMVLMVGAVFADGGDDAGTGDAGATTPKQGNLTVDPSITVSGLETGDKVDFYKILAWDNGWVAAPGFDGQNGLTAAQITALAGTPASSGTAAVSGAISWDNAKAIAEMSASATAKYPNVAETSGAAVVNNPEAGLYMAIIKTTVSGVVYNPVFVAADFGDSTTNTISLEAGVTGYPSTSIVKKDTITVNKEMTGQTNNNDKPTEGDGDSFHTTNVGDTVSFKITTKIPIFTEDYTNPVFKVQDTMSAGLDLKDLEEEIVLVKPANAEKGEGKDYTISVGADKKSFEVSFAGSYLKKLGLVTDVEITYKAKVTNAAVQNINVDENTVDVRYSTNPTDITGAGILRDKTKEYTFSIDASLLGSTDYTRSELVKVGIDQDGNEIKKEVQLDNKNWIGALEGATFGLYLDEAGNSPYYGTNNKIKNPLSSDADGLINITGLDAGVYWIKELSAPAGYIKDTKAHKIEIKTGFSDHNYSEKVEIQGVEVTVNYKVRELDWYTIEIDGVETSSFAFDTNVKPTQDIIVGSDDNPDAGKIKNPKGTELPSTGGIGTTIFYILGGLLVVGAVVILVARRKAQD